MLSGLSVAARIFEFAVMIKLYEYYHNHTIRTTSN